MGREAATAERGLINRQRRKRREPTIAWTGACRGVRGRKGSSGQRRMLAILAPPENLHPERQDRRQSRRHSFGDARLVVLKQALWMPLNELECKTQMAKGQDLVLPVRWVEPLRSKVSLPC